jgi:hypothetical protein
MQLFGYTVEWMPKGLRPNYRRDPIVEVLRGPWIEVPWFAIWIGERIRIGRKR